MKRVELTHGRFALVDDGDYQWLSRFKWHVVKNGNMFYAQHRVANPSETINMHRLIMGFCRFDGRQTDHIDGDGLNNQRNNLRSCTNQQNCFNRKSLKEKSSRFKGVYWDKRKKRWVAKIQLSGKNIWLGRYKNEMKAAKIYDLKAVELFGDFARLNFSERG